MKCPICNADNFDGECKECSYTVGENCKTFVNMIMVGAELDNGYYYMREPCKKEVRITHSGWINQFGYEALKIQIYAKVPTYDEYKDMLEENTKLKTENKWYSEQLNEAVKEIAKLKELLTMAREVLKMVDTYSGDYDSINGFLIVEKINQVLGEE